MTGSGLDRGRQAILDWYRPRATAYPWRADPDPYRVLVSEVMLQQTQVPRVLPAYRRFLERFPTVEALAEAPRSEVVNAWSGLGYNRRAVALSEAARRIVSEHEGKVPDGMEALARLPGVGRYTAAAVASMGHGRPVPAIDTNVRRVVARAILGAEPGRVGDGAVGEAAAGWLVPAHVAAWNQALMDLGREVCRPRPRCEACPLRSWCRLHRSAGGIPSRPAARPSRGEAFEGSDRQLRGAVVRELSRASALAVATLSRRTGEPAGRIAGALGGLVADRLVRAGPAALRGDPRGRVRLAD